MKLAILAALLILGADALLALLSRKGLIERILGDRYGNVWFRLPVAVIYAALILFVGSGGFQSWPWDM